MADYYKRGLKIDFDQLPLIKMPEGHLEYWIGKNHPGLPPNLPEGVENTRPNFADGGTVEHFDTGGMSGGGGGQQPFGYDLSQYVTNATNWANEMWKRGSDTYNWALDEVNKNEGVRDRVVNSALGNAETFDNAAKAGVSRYEDQYAPAMQQYLDYAKNYASEPNLALYRGQAMAGVGAAFDKQAEASADALQGYGVDPQAVANRLDTSVRTQRAAAQAGAGTMSDINAKLIGQDLLGKAIAQGQADAGITNQFASMGAAERNQAVNTGLATSSTNLALRGPSQQWAGMGATELKEWPKAELDSMHASNEQGALWNDINKTNLQAQQQASQQSSGFGAIAGGILGAASNMIKFAPIALAEGGVVPEAPHFEGGGFADEFAAGFKAARNPAQKMFELSLGKKPTQEDKDAGVPGSDDAAKRAASSAGPVAIDTGGSADGATGSGGDAAGGVSGSGGVGGSATGGQGGSAAAGVGGDDGGTYAQGGNVLDSFPMHMVFANAGTMVPSQGTAQAIQTGDIVPKSAAVSGIKGPDKVPAMVQPGEGILPKRVMDHIGKKGLNAIIAKVDKETGVAPQPVGGVRKPVPQQAIQTGPTFASQGALQ